MTAVCRRLETSGADPLEAGALEPALRAHVAGCPSCSAYLRDVERIAGAMPRLAEDYQRPPDHEARLRAALAREHGGSPRWRWRLAVALPLAAAAALAFVLLRSPPPNEEQEPTMTVALVARGDTVRGGDIRLGDRVAVEGRGSAQPHQALRVYLSGEQVVASCPPDCVDGDAMRLEVVLDAVGRYQLLWLRADAPLPPSSGDLERDVGAAAELGAVYELRELDVR